MRAQAEVSLYPLRTAALMDFTNPFVGRLRRGGLGVEVGPISSRVSGECRDMCRALREAFEAAAQACDVAVTVKVTNACPEVGGAIPDARVVGPAPTSGGTADENATRDISVHKKEEP